MTSKICWLLLTREGLACALYNGEIYAAGGNNLVVVEIYEIGTNKWKYGANLAYHRWFFTLNVVNGELIAFGGTMKEILDPNGGASSTSSMAAWRDNHASVVVPCAWGRRC